MVCNCEDDQREYIINMEIYPQYYIKKIKLGRIVGFVFLKISVKYA